MLRSAIPPPATPQSPILDPQSPYPPLKHTVLSSNSTTLATTIQSNLIRSPESISHGRCPGHLVTYGVTTRAPASQVTGVLIPLIYSGSIRRQRSCHPESLLWKKTSLWWQEILYDQVPREMPHSKVLPIAGVIYAKQDRARILNTVKRQEVRWTRAESEYFFTIAPHTTNSIHG